MNVGVYVHFFVFFSSSTDLHSRVRSLTVSVVTLEEAAGCLHKTLKIFYFSSLLPIKAVAAS